MALRCKRLGYGIPWGCGMRRRPGMEAVLAAAAGVTAVVSPQQAFAGHLTSHEAARRVVPAELASTGRIYQREVVLQNNDEVDGCTSSGVDADIRYITVHHYSVNTVHYDPFTPNDCNPTLLAANTPSGYLRSGMIGWTNGAITCTNSTVSSQTTGILDSSDTCYGNPTGHPPDSEHLTWAQSGWFKGTNCTPADSCQNGYTYGPIVTSPTVIT